MSVSTDTPVTPGDKGNSTSKSRFLSGARRILKSVVIAVLRRYVKDNG